MDRLHSQLRYLQSIIASICKTYNVNIETAFLIEYVDSYLKCIDKETQVLRLYESICEAYNSEEQQAYISHAASVLRSQYTQTQDDAMRRICELKMAQMAFTPICAVVLRVIIEKQHKRIKRLMSDQEKSMKACCTETFKMRADKLFEFGYYKDIWEGLEHLVPKDTHVVCAPEISYEVQEVLDSLFSP